MIFSGFYKIKLTKQSGDVFETDWIENTITNAGRDTLVTGISFDWCAVGAGTTPSTVDDTSLQTQTHSTTNITTSNQGTNVDSRYVYKSATFTFPTFSGSVSELGMGWAVSDLFSRIVISPITITVYDILEITYELRINIPIEVSSVVDIAGNNYTVTRGIDINTADVILTGLENTLNTMTANAGVVPSDVYTLDAYTPTSFDIHAYVLFDSSTIANIVNVQSGPFYINFDPAVVKNNTNLFGFDINYTWS